MQERTFTCDGDGGKGNGRAGNRMEQLFAEVTELCRDDKFLHSVMKKYHYAEEAYSTIKNMAEQMLPCLKSEAGWQDSDFGKTFPEGGQSFFAVGITLGKGIDELQEQYLKNGLLTESYIIEVLSSELLLKSYRSYTEWVAKHRDIHVARLYFLGSEISDSKALQPESTVTSLQQWLHLEQLPEVLKKLELPVTCNEAHCMIPKKSVVFYAALTLDSSVKCAGICLGCGRRDCPNRMEEKEAFSRSINRSETVESLC